MVNAIVNNPLRANARPDFLRRSVENSKVNRGSDWSSSLQDLACLLRILYEHLMEKYDVALGIKNNGKDEFIVNNISTTSIYYPFLRRE